MVPHFLQINAQGGTGRKDTRFVLTTEPHSNCRACDVTRGVNLSPQRNTSSPDVVPLYPLRARHFRTSPWANIQGTTVNTVRRPTLFLPITYVIFPYVNRTQWSNYEGARGGLAPWKTEWPTSKHRVWEGTRGL